MCQRLQKQAVIFHQVSVVPPGLARVSRLPSVETLGYWQLSLWDI